MSTDVQLASGGGRRGNKKLRLQLLQTLLRHQYSKNCWMAAPSSKVKRCLLSESAAEVEWGTARRLHDDPDSGTDSPSRCEVAIILAYFVQKFAWAKLGLSISRCLTDALPVPYRCLTDAVRDAIHDAIHDAIQFFPCFGARVANGTVDSGTPTLRAISRS